jgi:hypothetical protein
VVGDDSGHASRGFANFVLRKSNEFDIVVLKPVLPLAEVDTIDIFVWLDFRRDPRAVVFRCAGIWWIARNY